MSLESWFWKPEPCSPPSGSDSPDEWSLHECDVEDTPEIFESIAVVPSRADLAQQLLDDIEDYVKKEEPFTDWFEEKVNLPIFDDLHTEPICVPPPSTAVPVSTVHSHEDLQNLPHVSIKGEQEIAYILGHGHLTPPQSPPAVESPLPVSPIYIIQQPSYVALQPPTAPIYVAEPFINDQQSYDFEHEMAVVDEVVRGAAQQWEQWESSDSNSRSCSSDGTEDSDDPEWMPLDVPVKSTGRRTRQPRPYNVNDRRTRKKEQNKNAATRYRQKKKAEVNVIVEEERGLEDQNTTLKTKLTDVEREISYLKGLMRDVFRAKGLVQ